MAKTEVYFDPADAVSRVMDYCNKAGKRAKKEKLAHDAAVFQGFLTGLTLGVTHPEEAREMTKWIAHVSTSMKHISTVKLIVEWLAHGKDVNDGK